MGSYKKKMGRKYSNSQQQPLSEEPNWVIRGTNGSGQSGSTFIDHKAISNEQNHPLQSLKDIHFLLICCRLHFKIKKF